MRAGLGLAKVVVVVAGRGQRRWMVVVLAAEAVGAGETGRRARRKSRRVGEGAGAKERIRRQWSKRKVMAEARVKGIVASTQAQATKYEGKSNNSQTYTS